MLLAYVSGRHRELVEQAIGDFALPRPDFVIADVGSSVYRLDDRGGWHREPRWDARLARDWGEQGHDGVAACLAPVVGLQMQEAAKQGLHKLSYYFSTRLEIDALEREIAPRLAAAGVAARRVYSVDDLDGRGLLDVLPQCASKYLAIRALLDELGIALQRVVFCGDSGNDLDVLASPVPAVLVANATDAVKAQALALARERGHVAELYVAVGGFYGMNGNYSGGMLEGIAHYHPESVAWMRLRTHQSEETRS